MRVQISTKPIRSESRFRGVGIYARNLSLALTKNYPRDNFTLSNQTDHSIDLIHYPYFEPFFLTLPLYHSRPFVLTIHDLIPLKYPMHFPRGLRGSFKWQLQKIALRGSAHFITDSTASAKDIESILHIPQTKISVIPLAPGHTRTTYKMKVVVKQTYHLPDKFILYVGDINWNKNIPGLIKEFSLLKSSSLHLVLVGQAFVSKSPTIESNTIRNSILESGKSHLIHTIGYTPSHHLPALYSLATVYIQPSWDEGFGLPLLEAMSLGCPVLSSNRGSLREVGGDAVKYFDPRHHGSLAQELTTLLHSRELRTRLIEQGKSRAKIFTWDQTAKLTHAVYEKILAAH